MTYGALRRAWRSPFEVAVARGWLWRPVGARSFATTGLRDVGSVRVLRDSREVQVEWADGGTSAYHFVWLRVNCARNLHPSGQRLASPGDIPPQLYAQEAQVTQTAPPAAASAGARASRQAPAAPGRHSGEPEVVRVTWSDGHQSEYLSSWLRAHDPSTAVEEAVRRSWPPVLRAGEPLPKVSTESVLNGNQGVRQMLHSINVHGLCMVDGAGVQPGMVSDLARRVGPLSHGHLYGDQFDVISQESPRNIAYSNERLPPHMDLVYYESPPGLQFFHCLRFDETVEGGESTCIDAFEAARVFRERQPAMFEVLSQVPATFQKIREAAATPAAGGGGSSPPLNTLAGDAAYMVYQRPHFQVDAAGELLAVNWAPPFEGTLAVPRGDVAPYYQAYSAFQALLEEGEFARENTLRLRLRPGECLVINNRRLLHGREGFSGRGIRHLQGCYVNIDEATSRLRSLQAAAATARRDEDSRAAAAAAAAAAAPGAEEESYEEAHAEEKDEGHWEGSGTEDTSRTGRGRSRVPPGGGRLCRMGNGSLPGPGRGPE